MEQIPDAEIHMFCSNCQSLEVTSFNSIKNEMSGPDFSDLECEFYDDESVAPWFVCMQAAWEFYTNMGHFPGQFNNRSQEEFNSMTEIVNRIAKGIMADGTIHIKDTYIKEMMRYADSKIHSVAAFIGGVASQEAIKLLI